MFNSITDRVFYVQTASDGQARVDLSHRDVWLVLFCFCYYYFFAICGHLLHMTVSNEFHIVCSLLHLGKDTEPRVALLVFFFFLYPGVILYMEP